MDTFQQKWKSIAYEERPIINIKALDELRKLQNHITKGCLMFEFMFVCLVMEASS